MICKHKTGFCLPVFEKIGRKYFVDDRGCAKCDGDPKPPKAVIFTEPKPLTDLQLFYQQCLKICNDCRLTGCDMKVSPCQKAGHYEQNYFCNELSWPEPPESLQAKYESLKEINHARH